MPRAPGGEDEEDGDVPKTRRVNVTYRKRVLNDTLPRGDKTFPTFLIFPSVAGRKQRSDASLERALINERRRSSHHHNFASESKKGRTYDRSQPHPDHQPEQTMSNVIPFAIRNRAPPSRASHGDVRRTLKPYEPDPRNGEVRAMSVFYGQYLGPGRGKADGIGYVVMSTKPHPRVGDIIAMYRNFESLEEARAAARQIARRRNAVLVL